MFGLGNKFIIVTKIVPIKLKFNQNYILIFLTIITLGEEEKR